MEIDCTQRGKGSTDKGRGAKKGITDETKGIEKCYIHVPVPFHTKNVYMMYCKYVSNKKEVDHEMDGRRKKEK